jgi:hypothetical protein
MGPFFGPEYSFFSPKLNFGYKIAYVHVACTRLLGGKHEIPISLMFFNQKEKENRNL